MRKQLLLIAMFTSALNAGDVAKHQHGEMPQYLDDLVKDACDNYISKTAWNGALVTVGLMGSASATLLHLNPNAQTARNLSLAAAVTAAGGGLSYLFMRANAKSTIKCHEQTLTLLKKNHNNLLAKSIFAVGLETSAYELTIQNFQANKEKLENIFKDKWPSRANSSDIIAAYPDAPWSRDEDSRALEIIKKRIYNNGIAKTHHETIDDILKKCIRDPFLTNIVSNAAVNKNIELNLALHKALKTLHVNMKKRFKLLASSKYKEEFMRLCKEAREKQRQQNLKDLCLLD